MTALEIFISAWAVAVLVVAVILASRRSMFAFEIQLIDGKAVLRRGAPRAGFLSDVQEIAARNGIVRAKVRGIRSGRAVRLSFSGSITQDAKQQMRNAWSVLR